MRMIPGDALLEGKTRKLLNIDKLVFSSDLTVWSTVSSTYLFDFNTRIILFLIHFKKYLNCSLSLGYTAGSAPLSLRTLWKFLKIFWYLINTYRGRLSGGRGRLDG